MERLASSFLIHNSSETAKFSKQFAELITDVCRKLPNEPAALLHNVSVSTFSDKLIRHTSWTNADGSFMARPDWFVHTTDTTNIMDALTGTIVADNTWFTGLDRQIVKPRGVSIVIIDDIVNESSRTHPDALSKTARDFQRTARWPILLFSTSNEIEALLSSISTVVDYVGLFSYNRLPQLFDVISSKLINYSLANTLDSAFQELMLTEVDRIRIFDVPGISPLPRKLPSSAA
jgi:hypothetical protein